MAEDLTEGFFDLGVFLLFVALPLDPFGILLKLTDKNPIKEIFLWSVYEFKTQTKRDVVPILFTP
jgi:hypothetical protein